MSRSVRLSACSLSTVACIGLVACGNAPAPVEMAEQVAPASPLVGTWEVATVTPANGSAVIDPAQPGLFMFGADGYYSIVTTAGSDPRVASDTPWQATNEEKIAQYDSIIVNAGRYEISGSTLTTRPMLAKNQEFVGGHQTFEFAIDGGDLTLTEQERVAADGTPPANTGIVTTLRRLRAGM